LERYEGKVLLTGYTITMQLLVRGKSLKYPAIDTWKMRDMLTKLAARYMDKLIVPKRLKGLKIRRKRHSVTLNVNGLSLTLPKNAVEFLDCENFMMEEIAVLFLDELKKKLKSMKVGIRLTSGRVIGEVEVWVKN